MFYPVKILNAKGKLKKWISSKALNERHWKGFFENNGQEATNFNEFGGLKRKSKTTEVFYEPTYSNDY